MHVDWVTVTAQIVNFLVLVWLLRRFLYRPVLDAMARREQRIAARLDDAQAREEEAARAAQRHAAESEALERRRETLLAVAREDAEQEKQRLLEAARAEAGEARVRWQQEVARERASFLADLRQRSAEGVQAIARSALRDLADVGLEEQLIEAFLARLSSLDAADRAALRAAGDDLLVQSAFELQPASEERLATAVREALDADLPVRFEQNAALLCGIQLVGNGQRLGWDLAGYLDTLAERVDAALAPLAGTERGQ